MRETVRAEKYIQRTQRLEAKVYRKLDESAGNVLGYEVRGKLTEKEVQAITAELEDAIAEHGKLRVLVYLPEMPRPELSALDDDLGFEFRHMGDFERYAVVGDSALAKQATKLVDPLVGHLTRISPFAGYHHRLLYTLPVQALVLLNTHARDK